MTILASGSSGNATLIETSRTRLLVDAGLSRREMQRRLQAVGLEPGPLDGLIVTHEHTDHTSGLAAVASTLCGPTFLTEGTRRALLAEVGPQARPEAVECVRAGQQFQVGDIEVTLFSVPHDAAEPVACSFRANGVKVAIVTDLGYLPHLVRYHLQGTDCLILESNHDVEMLKVGPYPWVVKQRVMSRIGHLSNHAVAEFLADADSFDGRPRYLVLAHLSENNNTPELARLSAEQALAARPPLAAFGGTLLVASQRVPLGPIEL